MEERVTEILRDQSDLETERSSYEPIWEEICRLVLPRHAVFGGKQESSKPQPPIDPTVYDSTGAIALERFAAATVWMLAPPGKKWHTLTAPKRADGRSESPRAKAWLERVRDILFAYRKRGRFDPAFHEAALLLAGPGVGAIYTEGQPGARIRYEAIALAEIYASRSAFGLVDKVHRKYQLTGRQARQAFGDKLPAKMQAEIDKNPEHKHWFVNCVKPRADYDWSGRSVRMPWASFTIALEEKALVRESGYRTMPYAVGSMLLAPGENYGRSPAWTCLPDLRMVNKISKTSLIAKNRLAEPTYLAAGLDTSRPLRLRPNAVNYGWVDPATGKPLIQALENAGDPRPADDELTQRRAIINDAFMIRLFQILVETPEMTATEVLERAREKAALMAPTMGRLQSELLEQIIWREIDLLDGMGLLEEEAGPMPEELMGVGPWEIEYESTLARDMKADDGIAIQRTVEQLIPLSQIKPEVFDAIDLTLAARELANVYGMPAKLLRTPEQMEELGDQRVQAAQAAQLAEALPGIAQVAKVAQGA